MNASDITDQRRQRSMKFGLGQEVDPWKGGCNLERKRAFQVRKKHMRKIAMEKYRDHFQMNQVW